MKKLYLILLSVFALLNTAMAQELKVKSFSLDINDLTASTDTVPDKNGDPCALVKILVVDSIAKLEGFVLKTKKSSPTELWAYMSDGAKEIRIKPTHYKPLYVYFPNFGINGVEGKRTYILDLEAEKIAGGSLPFVTNQVMSKPTGKQNENKLTIPIKNDVCIEMVKVGTGTFMMGATYEMNSPSLNAKPIQRVNIKKAFYLGKTEVSQALWLAVMGSNPSFHKGGNLPVHNVSWNECQEFLRKLNSMTKLKFRLPTEIEWEYAAKGGNKSQNFKFSGSDVLNDVAWYEENSGNTPHLVGTKNPNELGLYDMSGNVWEWCQDKYEGKRRILRGGCWFNRAKSCLVLCRVSGLPNEERSGIGFRLALSE